MKTLLRSTALLAFLSPLAAFAHPGHPGHDFEWDFVAGVQHPLFGLDHLLAMVAVGLWAALLGGRARVIVPLAFVAAMGLGAGLARLGFNSPAVEPMIAASVVALGLLIATGARVGVIPGAAIAALFALFHGAAHATEFGGEGGMTGYALGFLLATALLHGVGLGLGLLAEKRLPASVTRTCGGLLAASGVLLFAL